MGLKFNHFFSINSQCSWLHELHNIFEWVCTTPIYLIKRRIRLWKLNTQKPVIGIITAFIIQRLIKHIVHSGVLCMTQKMVGDKVICRKQQERAIPTYLCSTVLIRKHVCEICFSQWTLYQNDPRFGRAWCVSQKDFNNRWWSMSFWKYFFKMFHYYTSITYCISIYVALTKGNALEFVDFRF